MKMINNYILWVKNINEIRTKTGSNTIYFDMKIAGKDHNIHFADFLKGDFARVLLFELEKYFTGAIISLSLNSEENSNTIAKEAQRFLLELTNEQLSGTVQKELDTSSKMK